MKTKDALMIGFQLGRIQRTLDEWDESKHKRDENGQFSSTGGGGGSKSEAIMTYDPDLGKSIPKSEKRDASKKYSNLPDKTKSAIEKIFTTIDETDSIDKGDAACEAAGVSDIYKKAVREKVGMYLNRVGTSWPEDEEDKKLRREVEDYIASTIKSVGGGKEEKGSSSKKEKRPYEKLPSMLKEQADRIVEEIERISKNDPNDYFKGKRTAAVAKKYKEKKINKEELQDEITKLMLS